MCLGWYGDKTNFMVTIMNDTERAQCTFVDLPSYTIYSATGSFFIPTLVMFFVYFKIYRAFAKHRARQIYRQKVFDHYHNFSVLLLLLVILHLHSSSWLTQPM